MPTQCASTFKAVADRLAANRFAYGTTTDIPAVYDAVQSAIAGDPLPKIRARLRDNSQLTSIPRAALLLADIVTLTGGSGRELHILLPEIQEPELLLHTDMPLPTEEVRIAFVQLPSPVVSEWLTDARPFIDEGRLVYLPERALMWEEVGATATTPKQWKIETLDASTPWGTWRLLSAASRQRALTLDAGTASDLDHGLPLIRYVLPFLDGVSLSLLHQVMADEHDTFASFRSALSLAVKACQDAGPLTSDGLTTRAQEVQRDMVTPALEQLDRKLKNITASRALRIAGAGVGTVGLTFAAVSTGGIMAGLAAGGLGVVATEYAAYKDEIAALKDHPWHTTPGTSPGA